jgi:hypothetical protein
MGVVRLAAREATTCKAKAAAAALPPESGAFASNSSRLRLLSAPFLLTMHNSTR